METLSILVIEDNLVNLELLQDILELHGHEISHAERAELGIEMAKAQQPDVILMDIGLPGIDGLEATTRLKADPQTSDIPIIALTSHAMKGDREKTLSAGCQGYISKPIDTRSFVATIHEILTQTVPAKLAS